MDNIEVTEVRKGKRIDARLREAKPLVPPPPVAFHERFLDGTVSNEERLIREFMAETQDLQYAVRKRTGTGPVRRGFHAKMLAGIAKARFTMRPDLPAAFTVGPYSPGASFSGVIRFSNSSHRAESDERRTGRGIAVRLMHENGRFHDLLLSNSPTSHARDAKQFMAVAVAFAARSPVQGLARLVRDVGPLEALRIGRALVQQTTPHVESLATERFWSRTPFRWGAYGVKLVLVPRSNEAVPHSGENYLHQELVERLQRTDVEYDFCLQLYKDEKTTPIEDASVEWKETDAPLHPIAQLVIPRQDLTTAEARAEADAIDALELNPWNALDELRPLGSMNRARKFAYLASADYRAGRAQPEARSVWFRGLREITRKSMLRLNRIVPWHRLPPYLGAVNLLVYRDVLRQENLYDTNDLWRPLEEDRPKAAAEVYARRSDGEFNDLGRPRMGCAGQRFGRNVPREHTFPEHETGLLAPSPREVSRRLLARTDFKPAESLNLLAAAWIQFQTHDWFAHQPPQPGNEHQIPLGYGDDWPENPMRIRRTPADPTRSAIEDALELPPTYINRQSHWWDGSQIYGSDPETSARLRTKRDGKLALDENTQFLVIDPATGLPNTGFTDNWWLGLHLLHTLFAQEHNAICDRLRVEHPYWSDDQLYNTARLINVGLMAKIHTVEWTPGILAHPTLQIGMRANWWGLATQRVHEILGRISSSEAVSGIPGSMTDHDGVPFALTEEFVSVYRLHSLIPDTVILSSATSGNVLKELAFTELAFDKASRVIGGAVTMEDVLYSFGTSHPGALTLHNFPNFLRNLTLPDGQHLDLAAVDIMRDRERGVPRYNEFRRLLHRSPVGSFEALTPDRKVQEELKELYGGDIERVDLQVGMLAEPLPKGFGFSDTAFRVFILMASRRLRSDRFFTRDFRPEIYTQVGLDWIEQNGMSSLILRHYPELRPVLNHVENPFAPWRKAEAAASVNGETRPERPR